MFTVPVFRLSIQVIIYNNSYLLLFINMWVELVASRELTTYPTDNGFYAGG